MVRRTSKKRTAKKKTSTASTNGAHLSYADAKEVILRQQNKALKYSIIAKKAIEQSVLETESQTPEISMYVTLRSEIKRRTERGESQRFLFLGNGLFALTELVTGVSTARTKTAIEQVRD